MRIGIFVVMAGRQAGGPETYEVNLVRALAAVDQENEYHVYCLSHRAVESFQLSKDNIQYHVLWPSVRWISIPTCLPIALMKSRADFLHATFIPPPFSPMDYLFTVHDIGVFVHPEFYHRPHVWRLHRLLLRGMKKARLLLCISENTRDLLADQFRIPRDRLAVVYHGVGKHFCPVAQSETRHLLETVYGLRRPYVLFVGQLKVRSKNLIRLLEAFHELRHQIRSDLQLVLVGRKSQTSEGLDETIERLQLRDHVKQLGHVPDEHLPAVYSAAGMLAFPTLFEGFGFPVVEAMACGTPVVTSRVSCLPEVAGGAAQLVDPFSIQDIAEGMYKVLTDSVLRESLRARGLERAKFFTWERTAAQTLEAYRKIAES